MDLIFQLLKFCVVGIANTAICAGLYTLFNKKLMVSNELSIVLAYALSFCNSFFWNKIWTFSGDKAWDFMEAALFLGVFLASLAVKLGCFRLLYRFFKFKAELVISKFRIEWAFLASMAVYTAVFFAGSRLIVFA
jgi:putative flippase GtrA